MWPTRSDFALPSTEWCKYAMGLRFTLCGSRRGDGVAFFGDPKIGGELGRTITMSAIGLGVVILAPIGFILGSILDTLVSTAQQKPKKTVECFAPQISGAKCSMCGEHILLNTDGRCCEHCRCVFHIACVRNNACPSCLVQDEQED